MDLNNEPLVRSLGSQDANGTKEVNISHEYEWMKNRHGLVVPIALHLVNDKLRRGFIRTDGITHKDNPADQVVAEIVESNPAKAMAMIAEQMAEASKLQTEAIKEIAKKRRNTGARASKSKSEETSEE
jgi:23S rRNA maturation mini-RNase III